MMLVLPKNKDFDGANISRSNEKIPAGWCVVIIEARHAQLNSARSDSISSNLFPLVEGIFAKLNLMSLIDVNRFPMMLK